MAETWFPFCTRRDGPSWKQGYYSIPSRPLSVIDEEFKHSTEGGLDAAFGVLDGPRQSSWPFTIPRVGPPFQHYSLESVCWTQGRPDSAEHNIRGIGQEHELYGAGMVINDNQIYWSARITIAIRDTIGRKTILREHNEVAQTDCPSGRILWTPLRSKIAELEAQDDMTQDEFNKMAEIWFKNYDPDGLGDFIASVLSSDARIRATIDDHKAMLHTVLDINAIVKAVGGKLIQ